MNGDMILSSKPGMAYHRVKVKMKEANGIFIGEKGLKK